MKTTPRDFSTRAAAERAIKKDGLQNVPYIITINYGSRSKLRHRPQFTVNLTEDRDYIRFEKGYAVNQTVGAK